MQHLCVVVSLFFKYENKNEHNLFLVFLGVLFYMAANTVSITELLAQFETSNTTNKRGKFLAHMAHLS